MSIKSNIVTLKSWLSEKVKETYEYKVQRTEVNLEGNTKQKKTFRETQNN